jgi:hypothetical protein
MTPLEIGTKVTCGPTEIIATYTNKEGVTSYTVKSAGGGISRWLESELAVIPEDVPEVHRFPQGQRVLHEGDARTPGARLMGTATVITGHAQRGGYQYLVERDDGRSVWWPAEKTHRTGGA